MMHHLRLGPAWKHCIGEALHPELHDCNDVMCLKESAQLDPCNHHLGRTFAQLSQSHLIS